MQDMLPSVLTGCCSRSRSLGIHKEVDLIDRGAVSEAEAREILRAGS